MEGVRWTTVLELTELSLGPIRFG